MKLLIGPFTFKVVANKYLPNVMGCTYPEMGEIHYGKDQDKAHQRETVLHESLHTLMDITQMRSQSKDEQEAIVSALSPLLYMMLRDNPKFVDWLLEVKG